MAGKGQLSKPAPIVPLVQGVPSVPGAVNGGYRLSDFTEELSTNVFATTLRIGANKLMLLRGISWGLFAQNSTDPLFPNCLYFEVGMQEQSQITDAPLEAGSFVSYNKVDAPAQYVLGMSLGPVALWSNSNSTFEKLRALRAGTDLCTVHMPNFTSPLVSVVGLSMRRTTSSGADLQLVFVSLQEVRTFATVRATMKNGYTLEQQNMGVVNAQAPTAAQAKAISA